MEKTFHEVLPDLQTSTHIMELLDEIRISRITMPRDRSSIRIYIECRTLIPKRDIYVLEAAIKKQFFANKPIVVKIIEHYHLGGMSPEEAMKAYRDSILSGTEELSSDRV